MLYIGRLTKEKWILNLVQAFSRTKEGTLYIAGEGEEKEKIEKNSSTESYRVGEGISQAVIFDICQSWYRKVSYDQMFAIENSKNGREKWSYVVKLPIIERGKENDTL